MYTFARMMYSTLNKGESPKKGAKRMKFNPTQKEARALADPQKARDLRRQIEKETEDMTVEELQRVLWNILRKKR